MNKIPTIFERDWNGDRKVINKLIDEINLEGENIFATEKIDGTNIRVTLRKTLGRSTDVVRVEKRVNPSKEQKKVGIKEPWYMDCYPSLPENKYIVEAVVNTNWNLVFLDTEMSCEAVGSKIQGNPYKLDGHICFLFCWGSLIKNYVFEDCPITYEGLIEWLPKQKSKLNSDVGIEGIVWHRFIPDNTELTHPIGKIKIKDFREIIEG